MNMINHKVTFFGTSNGTIHIDFFFAVPALHHSFNQG